MRINARGAPATTTRSIHRASFIAVTTASHAAALPLGARADAAHRRVDDREAGGGARGEPFASARSPRMFIEARPKLTNLLFCIGDPKIDGPLGAVPYHR